MAGIVLLLLVALATASQLLDPWLRRTLEKQVAQKSQGRYQLRIGRLHTSLGSGTITLGDVRLRPAKAAALWQATPLPRLLADVQQIRIAGVGLWALLRGAEVPVGSVVVSGGRVRVLHWPRPRPDARPLHEQLPRRINGLRIGYVALQGVQLAYGALARPTASVRQVNFTAQDILLSRAGAADTQRLAYTAAFGGRVAGVIGTVAQHRFRIGNAQFSSQSQRLTLDSVRIRSLLGVQERGKTIRVEMLLPRLRLTGISSAELRRRQLRLDSVVLRRPWVAAALPTQPPPPIHEALAPYVPYLALAHVAVSGGTLHLTGIPPRPRIQDIHLRADNVLLTAAGARAPARIWYARAWALRTGRIQNNVSAPVYWLGIRSTELLTRTGLIRANDITLRPTMTPAALARLKGHQTPHITVRAPRVQVAGFDFAAFSQHNALLANSLELSGLRVLIAGDGRFPLNPNPSLVTQESLAKLPVRLNVRRVTLTKGYVATSYVGPKTGKSGNITFNRLRVSLRNVTNDPRLMTAATPLVAQASGWMQNSWYAQASFRIPLLDPRGSHSGQGSFGRGSITLLNSVTEPSRLVRFESGNVERATVQFRGNRQQISGTMRAEYSDLKMTLLSQQGGPDQKTLFTKLGSKLLNGVVIRDDNPRGLGGNKLKTGSMQSRRDLRVSVFSLWRQGLVSGLLNSIGAPKKVAQRISEAP
ncbi:hypothetical protein [Hymenobacter metallicola]|uniref:DUF748 domain-containing protein n=1 Tax=Hymenobacter metallicola TaxID=2563114 RepID=A0A4Z0QF86_9BACT|nr:hypothetical protein [Hymenobacter metallicola]TGE27989.1 hypothetical protein E5K02_00560 [Hymenobacter metallicola]